MSVPTLDLAPIARLLKALADETRLRIVALLAHGELCVCHLHGALALSQPNISRHLAILRAAGIVETRREGSWIHYRLIAQEDPECARVLQILMKSFAARAALKRDVARLKRTRGPGACS